MTNPWYTVENVDEIPSPSLLIYPDRVEENIRRMIHVAGGVQRLRPHMKTNKLPEVIRMHLDQGITKFKCATIAEAEMIAACQAPDVLMAYQPVGPNVERFVELVKHFPGTAFSALADDADTIRELSRAAVARGRHAEPVPRSRRGHAPHRRSGRSGCDRALSADLDTARSARRRAARL